MSNEKPPLPSTYLYTIPPATYLFPPSNAVVPQPFFPVNSTAAFIARHQDLTMAISNYDNQLLQAIDKKGEKNALSLLENPPEGWDVNKTHGSGAGQKTLLIAACQKGLLSVVKALIESHGAALTYQIKKRKKTPLHFASENDHVDVVSYLLERDKTLIDEKNGLNWTALNFAVKAGSLRMVKILVENGADLSIKSTLSDETKHTPLSLAERYGHKEIKTYLQEKLKQNQNFSLDATSVCTKTTPTTTAITADIILTPAAIPIPQESPKIPFLFFKNKASQMEARDSFLLENPLSRKRIREEDVKNKGLSETKTEKDVELAEPPAKKLKSL